MVKFKEKASLCHYVQATFRKVASSGAAEFQIAYLGDADREG